MEIKPCGSYLELNAQGEIIPLAAASRVNPKWASLIEDYVESLRNECGPVLHSVYLRGSVAKGTDEEGISDFDGFVVINQRDHHFDGSKWEAFRKHLVDKYPFCTGVEGALIPIGCLSEGGDIWLRVIKTQSICLFGENLAESIKPMRLVDMIHYSKYVRFNLETILEKYYVEDREDAEAKKSSCVWAARILLRAGFETVMYDEKRWSNDLYLCYKSLKEAHPEKSDIFYRTLNLSLNPSPDETVIRGMVGEWIPWLYNEIRANLKIEPDCTY